jgi:30S ribosomal protein S31
MGKGDMKTKRGKISRGTFGVRRPRKKQTTAAAEMKTSTKKSKAKSAKKS